MSKKLEKRLKDVEIAEEIINGKDLKTALESVKKKTFSELLDKYMPTEMVMQQHKKMYTAHREIKQIRLDTLDDEVIKKAMRGYENITAIKNEKDGYTMLIINEVDREARKNAIELAYKIKGAFAPTQIEVKREFEDMDDMELMALIQRKDSDD